MQRRLQALLLLCTLLLLSTFYIHLYVFNNNNTKPFHPLSTHLTTPNNHHHRNLAIHETTLRLHQPPSSSVLLPDWEVLLLLPSSNTLPIGNHNQRLSCVFQNGRSSTARFVGTITSSARPAFICSVPHTARSHRPLLTPRLSDNNNDDGDNTATPTTMLRLNRLVYDSVSTPTDIILFAKGVNNRQGINRPASDLRCVFLSTTSAAITTAVTSSAQEVFRCPHPNPPLDSSTTTTVSLLIGNKTEPVPSLAAYRREAAEPRRRHSEICACTMVFNVAKFLREWVLYHSGIGVDRFVLYDNGSEDEFERVVDKLNADGFNVSTRFWPWPKTQEAGFSHCAAVERDSCKWMAFLDVDEFAFSPAWSRSSKPDSSMLSALLPTGNGTGIGLVSLRCRDFGPSGQRSHPVAGVTQGYTCRRRAEERHKSLVRLDAVDHSLVNSVHHFGLGDGWRTRRAAGAVVNHYKYQAWTEFKAKFRRRVSAYVADWTAPVNMESKDRTPGLGYKAVEPVGWEDKFCEVNDTRLRDTVRRWFRAAGQYKLAWEEELQS